MAVELYLRARQELRRSWGGMGDLELAVELFRQALARAPDDGSLLSGYAMARARRYNYRPTKEGEVEEIRAIAERAIAEAPHLGEPWLTLATLAYVTSDWPRAVRALRKALSLAPGLLKAHEMLAHIEVEVGRVDEGLFRLETVMSLDPAPSPARWEAVRVHAMRGRWDRADALLALPVTDEADRVMRIAISVRYDLWRGEARVPLVEPDDAARDERYAYARIYGAVLRDRSLARSAAEALRIRAGRVAAHARMRPFLLQAEAELAAFGGEHEHALDAISRAADASLYDRAWMEGCPVLAPLRSHPSWPALASRVETRIRPVIAALDEPSG